MMRCYHIPQTHGSLEREFEGFGDEIFHILQTLGSLDREL